MASFESDQLVVLINDTTLTSTASLQSALAEANQTGFTIRPLSNTYLTSLQDFTSFRTKYPQFNAYYTFIEVRANNTVLFQLRNDTS